MTQRRLGVMGGTFDPIHYGHLVAADQARHQFELDAVVFVPAGRPWQKPQGVSSAEDRHLMAVIATVADPAFSVSRIELDHPGATYTVDTLRRLRVDLPDAASLYLVAGADAVLQLRTWKDPDGVLRLAEVIAATRPGYDLSHLDLAGLAAAVPAAASRVHVLRTPALDISSTDLRARVAAGGSIDYLVPPGVARYVAKRGLYRKGIAPGASGG